MPLSLVSIVCTVGLFLIVFDLFICWSIPVNDG